MEKIVEKAVKEYQCSGCVGGPALTCYKKQDWSEACSEHCAGTRIMGLGKMFPGMPKGFNRLGELDAMQPNIYKTSEGLKYDTYTVPVWKWLSPQGHTFVRGFCPRVNKPFLDVILMDCMAEINCYEVTQEDMEYMD